MKYSMSIAMVAILLAAAFVGVVAMDDEADAAVDPVSIDIKDTIGDKEVSNAILGNKVVYENGAITGSVTKVTSTGDKPTDFVQKWYYTGDVAGTVPSSVENPYTHFMVFAINAGVGNYVTFIASDGTLKSIQTDNSTGKLVIIAGINKETCKQTFTYAVTAFKVTGSMTGLQTSSFEIDVQMDVIDVEIRYAVGNLTYLQTVKSGTEYSLVSLDDLKAEVPSGKKFVGWANESGNTYSIGTTVKLDNTPIIKYTAVFEALPEAVITFVDGTSTLKSINVSDLSEKTVPSVEKTGYTFDGWFMGDVKVDPLTYTFEESVTLVAQWTPINCYVTFVAGDFVKTVPVLYGDRVQAPALPDGFEKWNFDFSVVITDDLTITAVEKAPEKPTGLADPTIKMALVVVGLFVCVLLAVIILKREDIRAGMVRKLSKAEDVKEDKKE